MNCFAYSDRGCRALRIMKCIGVNCNFRKTREKVAEDIQRSLLRVSKLGETQQTYISDTYYRGELPEPDGAA
jgi:hypothetical protein